MKYIMGMVVLVVACTSVWAEPEQMKVYATLSAPIASFWQVQTEACEPVTMPAGSQLNLGFVECQSTDGKTCTGNTSLASAGGTIALQGTKPLEINELRMEKETQLTIGNARWLVETLKIGEGATATLNGVLVAKSLELPSTLPVNGGNPLTIDVNTLRVGSNITTKNGEFDTIDTFDNSFDLMGTSSGSASFVQVGTCSVNENNACHKTWYVLRK